MKKLYVYADFDWLKEIEIIGELGYESLRGSDSYCFTFNKEWLAQHGDLFLSDDLIIIPVSNIRNQVKTSLVVSLMPCPTDGDAPCCCVVNRLKLQRRKDRFADFHLLIS